jgi:hypothetical protein
VIRTGVVLPTFRETPAEALAVAQEAWATGVDGVFCFDHLWPIGQPDRPALAPFPVLAAVAATMPEPTSAAGPYIGTLVARVGLAPNPVLLRQFAALDALAPGRVIAGLGTGDRLNEAENLAYGIPFASAAARRADLAALASALRQRDMAVWIAGGASGRIVEARDSGSALTVWDAAPNFVAERAQGPDALEVTWAGPPPRSDAALEATVRALDGAGATWAVFAWPVSLTALVRSSKATGAGP